MSADVKANIKQEIKDLGALPYIFFKETPSKLEMQCKRGCIFHLIFIGISSILILSINNREVGWGGGGGGGWAVFCLTDKIC